jgi:hypothetical protein
MSHVDSDQRHQHIYGEQDGRNSRGEARDQQKSAYQFHYCENYREHRRKRYAEV